MASEFSCACGSSQHKKAHVHHEGHEHGHPHAQQAHDHHGHGHGHHDHDHGHGHGHHEHGHGHHGHGHGGHDHVHADIGLPRLGAAIALALGAELLHLAAWPLAHYLGLALAVIAIALSGSFTYRQGLKALFSGRLSMDALMAIAVTGAFAIGQWPEAAMVMALFVLAEQLEERASERANAAVARLLALAPQTAQVRDQDGAWQRVAVETVPLGARLRVAPGERVALDGRIILGHGALDEAALTGESLPVDKGPGDAVHAGSVNQSAELEIEVTAVQANSLLARIAAAVAAAQAQRAPVQRLVDRFAAIYTPAVAALALAVAVLTPLLLGWSWHEGVYRALVLLVIACPCALLLSTPVTLVSALTAAARRGVLIKGGAFLEQAAGLRAVALDKTGTLTEGRPQLAAFEVLAGEALELQSWARSLALRSDHPLSRAIAAGLEGEALEVTQFQAHPGCGVEGKIGERRLRLANPRWLMQQGLRDNTLDARLLPHEKAGHSLVLLADDERVLALCALADAVKPGAAAAVAELKALGLTPVMLTGDHAASARTVAAAVGISEVHAQLLPEAKLAAVTLLQSRHGVTAMVGDGINDAPALARADLGIAMGGIGSDIAMEAADIVVMNDELARLPETVRLARHCKRVLQQNMGLALGIKLAFLALAVLGLSSLWMAVFADVGASLIVIANGLRMLQGSSRARAAGPEHPPAAAGVAHATAH